MKVVTAILFFAVILAVVLLIPAWMGRTARRRGRRFWPWFFFGFVWPLALIALFASEDLSRPRGAAASPPPPPPPPPTATLPASADRLQHLERLAGLRDSGALTDDEFEREKARVLGDSG